MVCGKLFALTAFAFFVGCSPTQRLAENPEKPTVEQSPPALKKSGVKPSGHPVIRYKLIPSNEKESVPDQGLRYAIINKKPTDEELIDLALELHQKYPNSKFRIVDSSEGIQDLDAFFDKPLDRSYPDEFASKHYFAMA